jgi:hypothetical protein
MRFLMMAALAALVGCSEADIECGHDGMIIIPDDASLERQAELLSRNGDLLSRRVKHQSGQLPYATPESLEKAKGCP